MSQTKQCCVVYTDAGTKAQKEHVGFGIHGFIHSYQTPTKGQGAKYTPAFNGYLETKNKSAEVEVDAYIDVWSTLESKRTHSYAELYAVIYILRWILSQDDYCITDVYIYSDSEYVTNGVNENLESWVENNYKTSSGSTLANSELWQELNSLIKELKGKSNLIFDWIHSYSSSIGNYYANLYANRAIILSRKGYNECYFNISEPQGYWKEQIDYNRMFAKGHWYFLTNTPTPTLSDGRYVYHLGDHRENDNQLGKRVSDDSYAVLACQEQEPVLEQIRQEQNLFNDANDEELIIAKLSTIFQPRYYQRIVEHTTKIVDHDKRRDNLYDADGREFTYVMRPARLSYFATSTLSLLETLLDNVIIYDKGLSIDEKTYPTKFQLYKYMCLTDVTDYFYEKTTRGKCKLKDEYTNQTKKVNLTFSYTTFNHTSTLDLGMLLGMDLPSRNVLSALAPRDPKVRTLTWPESNTGIRYASIVDTETDTILLCSVYSNLYIVGK